MFLYWFILVEKKEFAYSWRKTIANQIAENRLL